MRLHFSVIAALIFAAGLNPQLPAKSFFHHPEHRSLIYDGIKHHYLILPAHGSGGHPAVILLHDGNEDASEVWRETSLPELAAQKRFILVAPQASQNKHWNDGSGAIFSGQASNADDVGYLKFLIAELINHHGADPEKIFMVGASNGGLMTMRFACEAGEYLRAAASVNSEIPAKQAANCSIPEPLPWLAINADHDPVVPFQGMVAGTVEDGHLQPELEPALLSFAFFADAAGCSPDVYTETLNALTEERVRSNCASGNSSIEYILHDASHAWPTEGIDPAAVIWAHFNQTLTIKTLSASN